LLIGDGGWVALKG